VIETQPDSHLTHQAPGRTGVRVLRAHQGQPVGAREASMMIKVSSDDTDGAWALLVGSSAPRFESGLHRHAQGSKAFYVMDGAYEFYADGQWLDVSAGDTVLVPAGALHGFRAGPDGGRGVVVYPGRQERWFTEVAESGGIAGLDPAAAARISAAHGVAQCGPLPTR
jgi:quercetin dioxygenase-like cupin family protein